jgi:hypothetical protein
MAAGGPQGWRHARILLRSPKDPFEVVSPDDVFAKNLFGTNAGNLIFLQATWKILGVPGATLVPDGLHVNPARADEINDRHDVYVIPLANAFRPSFEDSLIQMTKLIRRLRIPVVVLGVGAQVGLGGDLDRLRPIEASVRGFVSSVLDHAPSIGVRGEITYEYLRGLGYRDVEVIGCPSMFLYGDALRVEKVVTRLEGDTPISLNVSPYLKAMGPIVTHHLERYSNLTYVAQDLDTLGVLLYGETSTREREASGVPVHVSHPLFQQDRVRFYVEPWPWISDLRSVAFSFGSRIHGNIAAILAGTPAYVLAHDSRTLELARYFGIPHRALRAGAPVVDAAELYEEADYTSLNHGHAARFAVMQAYLRRHGLADVFASGDGGRSFDERVAMTTFPPAVRMSDGGARRSRMQVAAARARHGMRRTLRSRPVRTAHTTVLRLMASVSRPTHRDGG